MAGGGELGVVVVPSPILSHPSTALLQTIFASFDLVEGLRGREVVLVADGAKVGKYRPKRGEVPTKVVEAYTGYLDRVEEMTKEAEPGSIWASTRVVRLPEHRGFGHALLAGLHEVTTEFVLVVQHDHPFTARFSIRPVLDFMQEGEANYVSLPISTVFRHINRCFSLHKMDLRAKTICRGEAKFTPILFWYDGTHVARRSAYLKLVYEGDQPLPLGVFIEDTFSQCAMQLMREDFATWFPVYSTWMFQPSLDKEEALICHLDGRNYMEDAQRLEKGWAPNPTLVVRGENCEVKVEERDEKEFD